VPPRGPRPRPDCRAGEGDRHARCVVHTNCGRATIGPDVAQSVITKLDPKIIIPMHYNAGLSEASPWLPKAMPVPLDEFLRGKKNVERIDGPSFSVNKESLPNEQTIVVPKPPV